MIYRRILPIAVGAVAVAGGFLTLSSSKSEKRYSGSRNNDCGLGNYSFIDSKKFELLNTSVLLRHGARTPNYFIDSKFEMPDWESGLGYVDLVNEMDYDVDVRELPSKILIDEDTVMDEYIEHVKGRCQWGQLTLVGQEQSIAFGKELRRIYMQGHKILQKEFDETEIYCRSTKFPRTFYTLKGILAGIYGLESFDNCHRPIIYTMPISSDPMYPNAQICPVIGKFIVSGADEVSKDPEVMKMKCLLKQILGVDSLRYTGPGKRPAKDEKDVKTCGGIKEKEEKSVDSNQPEVYVPIYAVRDDLVARQTHEFVIPGVFPSLLPEVNRLSSQEILYEYLGGSIEWEERMALLVSPVINFVKQNMQTVIDGFGSGDQAKKCIPDMKVAISKRQQTMRMQILTCHDTTLIPLLVCLRIYDGQWPNFMSNLIVELYREKGSDKLFTRLIYNGKVQKLNISEDSCNDKNENVKLGLIPYSDFVKFLDNYSFPDDKYKSACDKVLSLFSSGKPITKAQYI